MISKEKGGVKDILKNFNIYFKYRFKKIFINTFFSHIILIVCTVFITSYFSTDYCIDKDNICKQEEEYVGSIQRKLEDLNVSHMKYTKLTRKEILDRWSELFIDAPYKFGSKIRENKYDCSTAVIAFLRSFGASSEFEDVNTIGKRAVNLSALGQLELRYSSFNVKHGDIILLKPVNGVRHCGIVHGVRNGWIQYADMNGVTKGMGFNRYRFNSKRIYKIIQVSYWFWCGNIMKKMSEKK